MDKSDQTTQGEDIDEETCLNGTTNESVQNCVRLVDTVSRTKEYDGQGNW